MAELSNVSIREMRYEDLTFAAECTAAEGWVSENRTTLEGFFEKDPKGCLLAEEGRRPVGIGVATFYGNCGFIGELIVHREARGRGIGAMLLNHGIRILKERGCDTVYLDGVLKAVELYEHHGFHKVCRSWRFSGHLNGEQGFCVRRMAKSDLDQVFTLDKASFGADRSFFLRRRLLLFPELCHVTVTGSKLTGFILGRSGDGWVSAGPWVVHEQAKNPLALLNALAVEAHGDPISVGVLDANQQACDLMRSLGFTLREDSPWRMALGRRDDLGTSPRCYAVGSAAKG